MITLTDLVSYLNNLLEPGLFKDYCPNGLQVEGKSSVVNLVTGVTANQALIDAAIDLNADAILVHHGFFWKNEFPCIVGMKYRRLKALLTNEISLLAYHLPLDAHPLYGNNAQLGKILDFEFMHTFEVEPGLSLGYMGRLSQPLSGEELAQLIEARLARTPLHINPHTDLIETVAWCSGGAQDYINQALAQDADAYISGEVSERTFHIAQENGIHYYAAGHHATEKYGVKALGDHLSKLFGLNHYFIDIPNPV